MTLQPFAQPPLSLALGAGRDLPGQAARVRAEWLAPRPGRAPAFLLALLWGRGCANVVQAIEGHLDALFADYACTPEGWPEAQAARQVLASLNMQLYRRRREGEPGVLELAAGLLLVHAGGVHFLQCGAVGLLRYRQGSLQRLGGSGQPLGSSAELALVQHNLTQVAGEPLVLAPQPLLEVADLRALGERCAGLTTGRLEACCSRCCMRRGRWRWSCRGRSSAPQRRHGIPAGQRWARRAPATAWMAGPCRRLARSARPGGCSAPATSKDARRCCCSRRPMPTKRSGSANGHCGAAVRRACREYCRRSGCVVMPSSCSLRRAGRCAACWIGRQRTCRWNRNARWSSWSNLSMRFAPCSGAVYRACGWRRGRSCWTRAGACCSSPRQRRSCRGWRARRCLRTACRWRRSCVAARRSMAGPTSSPWRRCSIGCSVVAGRRSLARRATADAATSRWASVRRTCRSAGTVYWRGPWRRVRRRASKRCRNSGWPCRSR
ncbi:putative protein kinase [Pseudomonas aeruginosa]|nr:putative protein kinase [Pseudomonas aeruginosa]